MDKEAPLHGFNEEKSGFGSLGVLSEIPETKGFLLVYSRV